jgi:hypothetical protein
MDDRYDGSERDESRRDAMTDPDRGERDGMSGAGARVQTLVCFTCGMEYYFGAEGPSGPLECEKCGGTVFRPFMSAEGDEVVDDFRESTDRALNTDDPEGEALPGDILDLNGG